MEEMEGAFFLKLKKISILIYLCTQINFIKLEMEKMDIRNLLKEIKGGIFI